MVCLLATAWAVWRTFMLLLDPVGGHPRSRPTAEAHQSGSGAVKDALEVASARPRPQIHTTLPMPESGLALVVLSRHGPTGALAEQVAQVHQHRGGVLEIDQERTHRRDGVEGEQVDALGGAHRHLSSQVALAYPLTGDDQDAPVTCNMPGTTQGA